MSDFNFVILYVENPARSEAFYADLLGRPAVQSSPAFVMFAMASGVTLGLWGRGPPPMRPAAARSPSRPRAARLSMRAAPTGGRGG